MNPVKSSKSYRGRIRYICQAGIIAALYTVLTCLVGAFDLASGAIQLRVSEAMCVLPVFMPAAIPGLTIGCLLSNLLTGCIWQDILLGPVATLLGALGAYLLRKCSPWLVPIPTVLFNTLIIPPVLAYAYHAEGGLPYLTLTVCAGEILSAFVLGMVLFFAVRRYGKRLFGAS